jgi:2-polyprenyl-3-methyl-5-hydroxy-6-metoxy-1,4-benzoquinol methylase
MSGLEYTKENAKRLEKIYHTRDAKAQRSETIRQQNLSVGENVPDIGCGPGFPCESMAEIVAIFVATD